MRAMQNFFLVLFAIIFVGNFALFGACVMSGLTLSPGLLRLRCASAMCAMRPSDELF